MTVSVSSVPARHGWELDGRYPGPWTAIAEVWHYRRMLYFVASRALQRVYRRTLLGWAWLFILPLLPIVLRALIFGGLLNVPSDGVPYLLFLTGGMLVWDLLALSLTWGARGLEMQRGVMQQVYVPSVVVILGNMAMAALDFVLKLAAFIVMLVALAMVTGTWYIGVDRLGWAVTALLLSFLLATGLSLCLAPWGEGGRDLRFGLAQVLPVWLLLTPVIYPMSAMPESWHFWVRLNPMAPVVETFKWAVFGVGTHDARAFVTAAAIILAILVFGLVSYARVEAATQDAQ